MKYIKSYKVFEADIQVDDKDTHTLVDAKNRLNSYTKDVAEYTSKKKQLENMILTQTADKNLDGNIKKLIGDNKILSMYLPIIHIKVEVKKLEDKIKYDTDSMNSRKNDISNASKLTDANDRNSQINNINNQIKEIQDRINDNNQKLVMLKSQLNKEESAMKTKIEDGKKDIQTLITKIEKG